MCYIFAVFLNTYFPLMKANHSKDNQGYICHAFNILVTTTIRQHIYTPGSYQVLPHG